MTDVIVVGGGIIGGSIAFSLARLGLQVALFDARDLGRGATQASAGMLVPYSEGPHTPAFEALFRASLQLYDPFLADLSAAAGEPVVRFSGGSVEIAFDGRERDALLARHRQYVQDGIPSEWLDDSSQLVAAVPLMAATACGGLRLPAHGWVEARSITRALELGMRAAGVQVHAHEQVLRLARDGEGVRADTDRGTYSARHAVLSAGAWSGRCGVDGAEPLPVRPVRGQLIALRTDAALSTILWSSRCYLVPLPPDRLLVGATVEEAGFDEQATGGGVLSLLAGACELVPALERATFEEVRVGLRPGSPDDLPLIGRSAAVPGLIYATGHYRNGVLFAPITAALVRGLIGEGRDHGLLDAVSPHRFPGRF